jgi:hypothetical protein
VIEKGSKEMTTTLTYIKEWQKSLQNEILHLKKYGSNKFKVINGRLLTNVGSFTYYFDTPVSFRIPIGAAIKLEWGNTRQSGRVLSSEGRGIIIALERSLGDIINEADLLHDPWELLEQLIQRFDEIKRKKQKRLRIKRLMDPSMTAKHPVDKIKNNIHELMLRSKYNPVTFVWGPPGTGKTYTLARVAANKYFQEKRVLILSHSNQAVDVIISELADFIKKKDRFQAGDLLRYGSNYSEQLARHGDITTSQLLQRQDPVLAENAKMLVEERSKLKSDLARSFSKRDSNHLLELETKIAKMLEKIRQRELEFVKEALIVGTTLAKAASDTSIYEKEYDVIILDEASMAYVPQVAFATTLGKRIIICGDFKQLPPISSSHDSMVTKWLKEDIFYKSGVVEFVKNGDLHPHLMLLKEQRRMHPDISSFTNRYIYHSLVGDHKSVLTNRNQIVEHAPFPHCAAILLDTSYMGAYCMKEKASNSRMNIWQALLSFQLIHEACFGGANSLGYVTPYRAQANLMDMLLDEMNEKEKFNTDIISATVHRFQGSERDIIVFDTVDSEPQQRPGTLLINKESERLINVAITRTKGKFIHVSNTAFIRGHIYQGKIIRKLVEHQEKHMQSVKKSDIGLWIKNNHPKLSWIHARKLDYIFRDIESARSSIIISLPKQTRLSGEWKEKLKNKHKQTKLKIFSVENWKELHADSMENINLSFPFVMIDQRLLWLGLPLEGMTGVQPPNIAARLTSVKICEYLLNQIMDVHV